MCKVVTIFRNSGVQTEIDIKDYSTAFDLAEKIKELGVDDVIVKIEFEKDKDGFSKYIMDRFTRRD